MKGNPINSMLCLLPQRFALALAGLPEEAAESVSEIRLRLNAPATLTLGERNVFFDSAGRLCRVTHALSATEAELAQCISMLTQGSLYRFGESLKQGYIPLPGGGRAGVCGEAALGEGGIMGFSKITSVNLRVPRQVNYFASPLVEKFAAEGLKGTLACGPPSMGKTTFLKSVAFLLATGIGIEPKRVGIADERCELTRDINGFGLADVMRNASKSTAISMLTRTMAPQVIICDEISAAETEAVAESLNSGVCVIAAAHCANAAQLRRRGRMSALLDSGAFQLAVELYYNNSEGYGFHIRELT